MKCQSVGLTFLEHGSRICEFWTELTVLKLRATAQQSGVAGTHFVFKRSKVRISVVTPAIPTDVFRGFSQPLTQMLE